MARDQQKRHPLLLNYRQNFLTSFVKNKRLKCARQMFFGNAPDTCYYIDRYQHTHTHTPSYINYEAHSEQKQKLQRLICIPFNNFFLWMMAFYGCNSEGSQEMHMLKATQHLPIFAKRTRYSCLDIERKS